MKPEINKTIKLIFFILITNTHFLQAHNAFNGGCINRCKESDNSFFIKQKSNNYKDKINTEENYSCLIKSLCRG